MRIIIYLFTVRGGTPHAYTKCKSIVVGIAAAELMSTICSAHNKSSSSSIYTQVEEERHMHIQNANQVAPAALARAGVFTTGVEASKFWIDKDERAR